MNTFTLRDTRRERLNAVLAALAPEEDELRTVLKTELAALQADDWTVSDRTYRTAGAEWIWMAGQDLKAMTDKDPVLQALGQPAALTDAQAVEISNLFSPPGAPHGDYLGRVLEVLNGDEAVLNELLQSGHSSWLAQGEDRLYPYEDVGVLLPLRLETLFDEPGSEFNPDPDRWQLLLRVIPDEPSICRDDPFVSEGEQQALLAFWEKVQKPGDIDETWLEGDLAAVAWGELSARVRAPRAAWLVSEIPVRREVEALVLELPAGMPDGPQPNRVRGLPPELFVFADTTDPVDGTRQHLIGRLPQDANKRIDTTKLDLTLPKNLDQEHDSWWVSWKTAIDVGLGGEWQLPPGVTPENIDALYVTGMGDDEPQALFQSKVDAGEMAIISLGTPTNNTGPRETSGAGLADWQAIAEQRLRSRLAPQPIPLNGAGDAVQRYLLGEDGRLPFFPGANWDPETEMSHMMAGALWPALWGGWLRDIWQVGEGAYRAGVWMRDNFYPEGPLPPLRFEDLPYGLLPVTALSSWQVDPIVAPDGQQQMNVELQMARRLAVLRAEWARLVRNTNNVTGKSTADFMRLLGRDALSHSYIRRSFIPATILFNLAGGGPQEIIDAIEQVYADARILFDLPETQYIANDTPLAVGLPLVRPTRMVGGEGGHRVPLEKVLEELYNSNVGIFDLAIFFREFQFSPIPDSLLLRLLFYACQQIAIWQNTPGAGGPEQEVWRIQEDAAFEIARFLDQEEWNREDAAPFDPNQTMRTLEIPEEVLRSMERAFRSTLDSAAQRIDPWITGFAWQRLRRSSGSWRGVHRLGAYGWLEGPFLGAPGPTDAGRLHAPSYNQGLAALVMRDKFLSAKRAAPAEQQEFWHMDITSSKARLAEELAEEVRMGFQIQEILGRLVENIIGNHQAIKELRTSEAYAMFPERKDPHEVCNGEKALRGLLGENPPFQPTASQKKELQHLVDALDTYGDLLLADGVMQLVNREVDRAAATMDAAAGFTRPPSFDFLHTPPSGYQLESVVVSALPFAAIEELDETATPGRLADASAAAFLEARLGTGWTWRAVEDGGEAGAITLAQLGLAPVDAIALPDEILCEMAALKLEAPRESIKSPREHELARQLIAALGSRPAAGRDLLENAGPDAILDPEARAALEAAIYEDLRNRYLRLYTAAGELISELRNAAGEEAQAVALRQALTWGLTPTVEPGDREGLFAALLGLEPAEGATAAADLALKAAAELEQRRAGLAKPEDLPEIAEIGRPMPDLAEAFQPDGVSSLARDIARLASSDGRLAILARWPGAEVISQLGLKTAAPATRLDEEWLTVTATTRAPLARLEALQLELEPPLPAWSSSPEDPWQTKVVADNVARRKARLTQLQMPRFGAAFGPNGVWGSAEIAVGMVDAFSEAVPMAERNTMTAFGFNAPAARAPQAILLAVPPVSRQRLGPELVCQILRETRELAQARTARVEDLGTYQALVPAMWLQGSGLERVRLEPYPITRDLR